MPNSKDNIIREYQLNDPSSFAALRDKLFVPSVNEALKKLQAFSDASGVQQFLARGDDGRHIRVSFVESDKGAN